MSGRWFDSSRQIFWNNNNQDLSIPGILRSSTAMISSIVMNSINNSTAQISSLTTVNVSSLKEQVGALITSSIGINCNTPVYRLDVNGTTRIANDKGVLTLQGALDSNSLFTTFQKATLTGYVGWFGFGLQGTPYSNYFGMQAPANGNIAFYPGGAAAASPPLFLGSNGNVGINCNTPAYKLDVNGTANFNGAVTMSNLPNNNILITSGQQIVLLSNVVSAYMYTHAPGNRIRIGAYSNVTGMPFTINEAGGNVGINCNAPLFQLDANGNTNVNGNLSLGGVTIPTLANGYKALGLSGGNSYGYMYGAFQSLGDGIHLSYNYINCNLGNTNGNIINTGIATSQIDILPGAIGFNIGSINAAPTNKMYLNAIGLGFGLTTPNFPIHVNVSCNTILPAGGWQMWNAGTGAFPGIIEGVSIYGIGTIWSGNRFVVSSDERIKQDITPLSLDSTIQLLQKITPVSYTYKDIMRSNQVHVGFIAQAVEDICPNAVSHSSEYIPNINTIVSTMTMNSTVTTYLEIDPTLLNSSIQFYTPSNTAINGKIVSISSNSFDTLMDTILPNYSTLLCKGVSVNDFRVLDKDYIFTLNVAATKKLMELVEQQGSTIKSIQEQLSTLQKI